MAKLIVDLNRLRNVVYGTVTYTDSELRRESVLAEEEDDYEDLWRIESSSHPEMAQRTLYVQGSNSAKDDQAFCYDYDTEAQAIRAVEMFEKLIDRVNNG